MTRGTGSEFEELERDIEEAEEEVNALLQRGIDIAQVIKLCDIREDFE